EDSHRQLAAALEGQPRAEHHARSGANRATAAVAQMPLRPRYLRHAGRHAPQSTPGEHVVLIPNRLPQLRREPRLRDLGTVPQPRYRGLMTFPQILLPRRESSTPAVDA